MCKPNSSHPSSANPIAGGPRNRLAICNVELGTSHHVPAISPTPRTMIHKAGRKPGAVELWDCGRALDSGAGTGDSGSAGGGACIEWFETALDEERSIKYFSISG